jgi:hypothetical protein
MLNDTSSSLEPPFLPRSIQGFLRLSSLVLSVQSAEACLMFISAFSSPTSLRALEISSDLYVPLDPIFDAIPDLCKSQSLRHLEITSYDVDDHGPELRQALKMRNLHKLFPFRLLQTLHLNEVSSPKHATDINDEEIIQLSKAWPDMMDLQITTNYDVSPRITYKGVAQLTRVCPRLHTLWIGIDSSKLNAAHHQDMPKSVSMLTTLMVANSSKIPDPVAFGTFLGKIAPNLRNLQWFGEEEGEESENLHVVERALKTAQLSAL